MNVSLVGFMACGKTVVGRRLAQRLGYRFLDTDHYIEDQLGRTIAQVFASEGEAYFRRLESALAERLAGLQNHVISTGGGMVTIPGNMERLKRAGAVVFLNADPEDIIARLQRDTKRPMVQGHELRERVTGLLADRRPYYEQADIIVSTAGKSINRVAGEIIQALGDFRRAAQNAGTDERQALG